MTDRLESNTRTVMVLTGVSRVAGLVRDGVLSRCFGANELTSAFWFAFLIPNLFRRLFGEGALTASFLPVYTKLR
ncbi:MAG: lipid II flippase MurJ, partial [Phycisphaerales bacterium]|nr:lipid II flippase MurJ [Phycisphaerales bacterium]